MTSRAMIAISMAGLATLAVISIIGANKKSALFQAFPMQYGSALCSGVHTEWVELERTYVYQTAVINWFALMHVAYQNLVEREFHLLAFGGTFALIEGVVLSRSVEYHSMMIGNDPLY